MKTKQKTLFILFSLFLPFYNILAQTLENIPGQNPVAEDDLVGYLNSLYKFGISITGILAIFMIGLGAFAYMVTSVGNSSKMMDAKNTITNALIGLTIALTAYLLLYVINPDLVKGTLKAPQEAINRITSPAAPSTALIDGSPCRTLVGLDYVANPGAASCTECPGGKFDPGTATCGSPST